MSEKVESLKTRARQAEQRRAGSDPGPVVCASVWRRLASAGSGAKPRASEAGGPPAGVSVDPRRLSTRPVKGMRRIGRQAVVATSVAIATPINAVFAVMASLTQALKLTEPELVPRSAMRHNVVGDRRRRHAILFQASGAERLDRQLMLCRRRQRWRLYHDLHGLCAGSRASAGIALR
jgi:hypothetical protein